MADVSKPLLQEAQDTISGDRQSLYGDPQINFDRVAKFWSIELDREVTALQVARCMVHLKMARGVNDPTYRDNYVDVAGYVALAVDFLLKGKTR